MAGSLDAGAAHTPFGVDLAAGVLGYLVVNGFLVNHTGELTWAGTTSLWQMLVVATAVAAGLGLRWRHRVRARAAVAPAVDDLVETQRIQGGVHGA